MSFGRSHRLDQLERGIRILRLSAHSVHQNGVKELTLKAGSCNFGSVEDAIGVSAKLVVPHFPVDCIRNEPGDHRDFASTEICFYIGELLASEVIVPAIRIVGIK